MNTRAWAFAAMICALLLGTPTTLADGADDGADDDEESYDLLSPFDSLTRPVQDACVSMLDVTLVSFGGTIEEGEPQRLDIETLVQGELHRTFTTVEEVLVYPEQTLDLLGLGGPYQEIVGPPLMELVETTRTTVSEVNVTTPIHVEWVRDVITWERVERSTLVPLPADLTGVNPADIVTVCDEERSLQAEMPVHGGDYDVIMVGWWPEQFAPEIPEDDEYIRITDLTIGVELDEDVEPLTLDQGLEVCPADVADAILEALEEHAPIVHENVTSEDDGDDGQSDGEDQDDAEAGASFDGAASRNVPLSVKASAGGVGMAGLLGSLLFLRRRV